MESSRSNMNFPFLKLPAEIRNMIYHLAMPAGLTVVNSMNVFDFFRATREKRSFTRSIYAMPARRACCTDFFSSRGKSHDELCRIGRGKGCPYKDTTYEARWSISNHKGRALLTVNHEISREAMPIFYGNRTFSFTDMSCLIPFLKDRAPESVSYIRYVKLNLEYIKSDILSEERQHWRRDFGQLRRFYPTFAPREMVLRVRCDMNIPCPLESCPCIKTMAKKLGNLDRLGVQVTGDMAYYYKSRIHEAMFTYLAPLMLKNVGGDHDPVSLQPRRILPGETGRWEFCVLDETDSDEKEEPCEEWRGPDTTDEESGDSDEEGESSEDEDSDDDSDDSDDNIHSCQVVSEEELEGGEDEDRRRKERAKRRRTRKQRRLRRRRRQHEDSEEEHESGEDGDGTEEAEDNEEAIARVEEDEEEEQRDGGGDKSETDEGKCESG